MSTDTPISEETIGLSAEQAEQGYQHFSEDDLLYFASGLQMPTSTGTREFSECMAPFQREFFAAVAPSLIAVREGRKPQCRRFWVERTKGASKDSDLAICLLWLLAFPKRPITVQVGAGDRGQAAIIRKRMEEILFCNEWLQSRVEIRMNRVVSFPGHLVEVEIMASDAKTAHGGAPNVTVLNELTHVQRWEFMQTMMSNASKVPWGLTLIVTNAGTKGTKAEVWRKNAIKNKDKWRCLFWDKPAPWIDQNDVEDEKQRMPSLSEFNRLWFGRWSSGKGDALSEEDITRCLSVHSGPMEKPEPGWICVAGLDLGVSHDHSGLVVLGTNPAEQRIRILTFRSWKPDIVADGGSKEVDLVAVEQACFDVFRRYGIVWFGYDPAAGGSYMAQILRRKQVPMREMTFSSQTNLSLMATSLVQAMKDRKLDGYDDAEGTLRRDLGKFSIKSRVAGREWGYKLDAVSDETGHADVGTALVICLPKAVALLYMGGLSRDDQLIDGSEGEPTEEDLASVPDDLRELYEGESA